MSVTEKADDLLKQSEFCLIEVPADHIVVRVHLIGKLLYVHYGIETEKGREDRIYCYDRQGDLLLRGESPDSEERFWVYRDGGDEGYVIYTHDEDVSQ